MRASQEKVGLESSITAYIFHISIATSSRTGPHSRAPKIIMPEMGLKKLNLSLEAYNADTHISPKGKSLKMQKVRPA